MPRARAPAQPETTTSHTQLQQQCFYLLLHCKWSGFKALPKVLSYWRSVNIICMLVQMRSHASLRVGMQHLTCTHPQVETSCTWMSIIPCNVFDESCGSLNSI